MDSIKTNKYLIKFYFSNHEIRKCLSNGDTRRISTKIGLVNFEKAYLKVTYGKAICNLGCLCEFYNDGWYYSKEDLKQALDNFRKEEL
jgi:hypothetical protein